jgi:hypothetical protein
VNRFSRSNEGQLLRDQFDAANDRAAAAEAHAERLRVALDAVPVGMIVIAPDGALVVRNRAAVMPGHADILVKDVVDRLCTIARRGQRCEERVSLYGPPTRVLLVRALPLPAAARKSATLAACTRSWSPATSSTSDTTL